MMCECVGKEPVETIMKEFVAACYKCDQQGLNESDTNNIDFQSVINEIRRNAVPWGSSAKSSPNFGIPTQFIPVAMIGGRTKRQALSAAQKLEYMKEKMTYLLGNATCVLKEMG